MNNGNNSSDDFTIYNSTQTFRDSVQSEPQQCPTTRERVNIPLVIFITFFFLLLFPFFFSAKSRCSLFSHSLDGALASAMFIIIIVHYSTVCIIIIII